MSKFVSTALALMICVASGLGLSPKLDAKVACLWGVEVVDGDTINCHDKSLRLKGINAPEIRGALCAAEHELGLRARARLETLAALRDQLPAQRSSGGGYGRGLASFSVSGVPVGEILVREGLAVRSDKRRETANHWCPETISI